MTATATSEPTRSAPPEQSAPLLPARDAAAMLRPVRAHVLTSTVLCGLAAGVGIAPYIAIAEIARDALTTPTPTTVWTWIVIGVTGAMSRLVLLGLGGHTGHIADANLLRHLRKRIVRRLGAVPLGWFRSAGSGRVKKAMNDDLEAMHHLIAHALGEMIGAAVGVAVGFGYLLLIDWRMALISVAVPAVAMVVFRVAMRSMSTHMNRLMRADSRIGAACVEYTDGITVIKTFGTAGESGLRRFDAAVAEQVNAMRAWTTEVRYSTAITHMLGSEMTVLAVVLASGLGFVTSGSLTTVELIPFLVIGLGFPTAMSPLISGAQGLRQARVAAGSIDGLLSMETLPEPARPWKPSGHDVELDAVSFSYDGVSNAVDNVSFTCQPGTVTALVGPSGAGKSTIASLLPRFWDVDAGAISIGGIDVRDMDSATLLSSLSLVFQDVILLRDNVTENIRIACPSATEEDVRRAAKAAQIHDVIARLPDGYDTVCGEDGGGLSGGERQRLTIARAILSAAPIVVLDEATASLDPDSETAVQRALEELTAGKTVIVVAHRLHSIAGADNIIALDNGQVVESGTHDQLMARDGLYARMWRAQGNGDLT